MQTEWYANLLSGLIDEYDRSSTGPSSYFLKPGYRSGTSAEYFVDDTPGVVYQPDVYPLAAIAARHIGASMIVDVGCGRAAKLLECAGALETVGIDFGANLAYCRERFPDKRWIDCDVDRPHVLPLSHTDLSRSLIVCSDVIEHLVHPHYLLASLREALSSARLLILSTPNRDLIRGIDNMGPPPHPPHVREWNLSEFLLLLEHFGLHPVRIGLTRADDRTNIPTTILVICKDARIALRRCP